MKEQSWFTNDYVEFSYGVEFVKINLKGKSSPEWP